jgi:two-component system chemotaxis sensor kinase CheA/two-component system sensor histidine kinase and response regulator WspE
MTERSRQLRAFFRATAVEQLAHLRKAVHELRRGDADAKAEGAIAPMLHLMKGDAALVGMMELAAALHAAEERACEGAWDTVSAALDAIARDLGRQDDPRAPDGAAPVDPEVLRSWVRLQTDAIDELSDRLLELSTAYNRLAAGLVQSVQDAPAEAIRELADNADAARRQLDEVLGAAWSLRLASIDDLLLWLADHAVELARAQGKPLQIRIDGGRAELERSTLEAMEEPLLRLVRNAILHGIEEPAARGGKPAEATLVLDARVADGLVEITIEDDGRGIDPVAVRAAAVERGILGERDAAALSDDATLELLFELAAGPRRSGRGIGLAVVRARIESLGGSIALWSRFGRGTRCMIRVPAAIARERALVVECAGGVFALPARAVSAQIRIGDHARRRIAGGVAIRYGEGWAPLCGLDAVLGFGGGTAADDDTPALVLEGDGRCRAFVVDRVDGEQVLLRRPADELAGLGELVSASSVTGDGRVALWLSVPALLSGSLGPSRRGAPRSPAPRTPRVLVVDDSLIVRELVSSMLRSAGLVATTAADGEAAWRALDEAPPDLIVTDIDMPRLGGLELLRRIRECWPNLPAVVLTTRDDDPHRRRAYALGASAYILKSELDEAALVETIRQLIQLPS